MPKILGWHSWENRSSVISPVTSVAGFYFFSTRINIDRGYVLAKKIANRKEEMRMVDYKFSVAGYKLGSYHTCTSPVGEEGQP